MHHMVAPAANRLARDTAAAAKLSATETSSDVAVGTASTLVN
jgi:hypothetical protein